MPTPNQLHPFRKICSEWMNRIDDALVYKDRVFGSYARKLENFFCFNSNSSSQVTAVNPMLLPVTDSSIVSGSGYMANYNVQLNQLFESVALFGPTLMGQVPTLLVNPKQRPVASPEFMGVDMRDPEMVMAYQQYLLNNQTLKSERKSIAEILEFWINWLQNENGKVFHSKRAVTQAIVSGCGGTYTEMYQPPGSQTKFARSRYMDFSRVVWDQDARNWEDITWMAILFVEPFNRVSEKFGIPYEELRKYAQQGMVTSQNAKALYETRLAEASYNTGRTHDLICYWDIYSKNGVGQWMSRNADQSPFDPGFAQAGKLDRLGRFVKLSIVPGMPYPLNAPTEMLRSEDDQSTIMRFQWETPFWVDESCGGGWPFMPMYFENQIASTYPMAIGRSVLAEMEFVNHVMGKLTNRIDAALDTIIGVQKSAIDDIKRQLNQQIGIYKILEISVENSEKLTDLIQFLNSAIEVSPDVWKLLAEVMERVNKGMGTTDLVYGQSSAAFRSATEADVKSGAISVRPEDMAAKTDTFLSNVAKKELLCSLYHNTKEDLTPILGPEISNVFEQKILTKPIEEIAREYAVDVIAGSTQKTSQKSKRRALTEMGQYLMPVMQMMIEAGNPEPFNAWISDLAATLNIDPERYLVPPPPPPPPPEAQGPSPEEQKMMMQNEQHQQKMMMKDEEHQQKMMHNEESAMADLSLQDLFAEMEMQQQQQQQQPPQEGAGTPQ